MFSNLPKDTWAFGLGKTGIEPLTVWLEEDCAKKFKLWRNKYTPHFLIKGLKTTQPHTGIIWHYLASYQSRNFSLALDWLKARKGKVHCSRQWKLWICKWKMNLAFLLIKEMMEERNYKAHTQKPVITHFICLHHKSPPSAMIMLWGLWVYLKD